MPAEPKRLESLLTDPSGSLANLLDRTARLADLSLALRKWLAEPWAEAVRVANLRDDTVVVYCANAAALTHLRYRNADLLAFFRQRPGLTCNRIELRVKPLPRT